VSEEFKQFLLEGCLLGSRYTLGRVGRAPRGTAGNQLTRAAGESLEFMDHREYQPGDDIRRLDWSASARADKLIVKLFQQELCPHLDIVLDGSKSMALQGAAKVRAALILAAALATAAANAGFGRRTFLAGDTWRPLVNAALEPPAWGGLCFDATVNPAQSFLSEAAGPASLRANGLRVLISDLCWLGEPLELLTPLAHNAAGLFVLFVPAMADLNGPGPGHWRLVDSETRQTLDLSFDQAQTLAYRQKFQRHQQNWEHAARQAGANMVTLPAEDLCERQDLSRLVEVQLLNV
jgi:uncharacterized protein (DUF58 family)